MFAGKVNLMKKCIHGLCFALLPVCIGILAAIGIYANTMPEQFRVLEGTDFVLEGIVSANSKTDIKQHSVAASKLTAGNSFTASLRLFGIFPIKDVAVQVVNNKMVVPCGTPFGIKMYTDGVLVVGLSEVDTPTGPYNPAKNAGIKVGDVIERINDEPVSTIEDIARRVEQSGGKTLRFRIRRNNLTFEVRFTPAKSVNENRYKAGMWVRDSSAGIGTLTFYMPQTGTFAGLGHPVCDVDTGDILPIASGEIVPGRIYGVNKGTAGTPGELRGGFEDGELGRLILNSETGVYGHLTNLPAPNNPVPIAMKQQVRTGYAQILCTVEGSAPKLYDIRIDTVRYNDSSPTRNMVIIITDEELLAKTGGIVQGMSGSPILQDGKLVGAVTHVFINDPQKGYAIFAENMLRTAESIPFQMQQPAA